MDSFFNELALVTFDLSFSCWLTMILCYQPFLVVYELAPIGAVSYSPLYGGTFV